MTMNTGDTLRVLSWNIQHGRNSHGQIRLDQTIEYILQQEPPDLVCLQEVARRLTSCVDGTQPDQLAALSEALSDYQPVWGAAFSWPGEDGDETTRIEFGNLTLVRLPLLDRRVHVLPPVSEACTGRLQTPRCAIETLVSWRGKPVRIFNTHLAYHCVQERRAQLEYLVEYQQSMKIQKKQHKSYDSEGAPEIFAQPHATRRALICGDLNLVSEGSDYHFMRESGWHDGWLYLNPAMEHEPTCGIYDREQWPEGPHCRDYFWFQKLKPLRVSIDGRTRCSDHQPLLGEFEL